MDKWLYEFDLLRAKLGLLRSQNWKVIRKAFIVSTGRTGTQFLARFFNSFSDVYANHEPKPDFLGLSINYVRGDVTKEYAVKAIECGRRPMFRRIKRKGVAIYIESNNRFFSLLKPLQEVFDDFRLIHIIRDGRDYVRSGMSRSWYTDNDPYKGKRMEATYFEDDEYRDQWSDMTRFEKIAWRWQKKNNFIFRATKDMKNVLTLKFEEIFQTKDYEGIRKIAEYIGLPKEEVEQKIEKMMSKKINATKEYKIPEWTEWGQDLMKKFDRIAGALMRNYYKDYNYF